MKILLSYLLGYLEIVVEGYYIEKFINICISKKINIWNLKREKSSILYARILRSDFKMLKEICRQTNTRVRIKKKKGFSFVLNRYKKRKISLVFFVIIMTIIFSMSNFIWNIEIIGNEKINKEDIIKIINDEGIRYWKIEVKFKYKRYN